MKGMERCTCQRAPALRILKAPGRHKSPGNPRLDNKNLHFEVYNGKLTATEMQNLAEESPEPQVLPKSVERCWTPLR